jgi:sulfatase modifying factor 1
VGSLKTKRMSYFTRKVGIVLSLAFVILSPAYSADCFAGQVPPKPARAAQYDMSNTPKDMETLFWNSLLASGRLDDFEAYLAAYPNGRYASIAMSRLPEGYSSRRYVRKAEPEFTPRHLDPMAAPAGMTHVKGGCFNMGDTFGVGNPRETPVHKVCLDDFYMDKYLVTQGAYEKLVGRNPSKLSGIFEGCPTCPVVRVNWDDSNAYCAIAGRRLPTEAEWEYSARDGGKNEKWAGTSDEKILVEFAWYDKNSEKKTHPVGERRPNSLGLYDIDGNVFEWVADWYDADYYKKSPELNPKGPPSGQYRVLRGGSWYVGADVLRSAFRAFTTPEIRYRAYGFRCAR